MCRSLTDWSILKRQVLALLQVVHFALNIAPAVVPDPPHFLGAVGELVLLGGQALSFAVFDDLPGADCLLGLYPVVVRVHC